MFWSMLKNSIFIWMTTRNQSEIFRLLYILDCLHQTSILWELRQARDFRTSALSFDQSLLTVTFFNVSLKITSMLDLAYNLGKHIKISLFSLFNRFYCQKDHAKIFLSSIFKFSQQYLCKFTSNDKSDIISD